MIAKAKKTNGIYKEYMCKKKYKVKFQISKYMLSIYKLEKNIFFNLISNSLVNIFLWWNNSSIHKIINYIILFLKNIEKFRKILNFI